MIEEQLREVRSRIQAAQERSPYAADEVKLLAVSKTFPMGNILEAVSAGQMSFGENRVQELLTKYEVRPDLSWHLIGHLQTNKVKYIIGKTVLIHSLDRLELAEEIEKRSAKANIITHCLVQLNIAEEETKSGLMVGELRGFLDEIPRFPHLSVDGLMTIGPHTDDGQAIRACFAKLRELKTEEQKISRPNCCLRELSMGMSHDFEMAVEEGATIVRVGSSIFGQRDYTKQKG